MIQQFRFRVNLERSVVEPSVQSRVRYMVRPGCADLNPAESRNPARTEDFTISEGDQGLFQCLADLMVQNMRPPWLSGAPQPSLLQAEQAQLHQPFLTGKVIQPSDHLQGSSLNLLQLTSTFPVLQFPKLCPVPDVV